MDVFFWVLDCEKILKIHAGKKLKIIIIQSREKCNISYAIETDN